ncbi:glycoside hydrolase superfamily, partial [Chytriomyces sp. MP71]
MVRTRKGWKDQGPCTIVDANNAFFAGVNSYFLHTVPEEDQRVVLMALQRARVSAVRIFVAQVYQGSKGTNSSATADLEDGGVGVYDDSVLQLVDTLMARALEYGIKLIVTMHDRWSLDSTYTICDAYCHKFVISNSTTNKHNFYNNPEATTTFDSRLARIALHKNSLMGGKTWAELDTVILAFEIENEAQGTSGVADTSAFRNKEWWCDRATALRHAIGNSRVLISTGGGQTFEESFIAENFACKALDVVAGHSYSLEAAYVLKSLSAASKLAHASGQQIWYEEFGVQVSNADANVRAKVISGGGVLANTLRVSWMPWEVVNPNNQQDFEFWTTDALTWGAFSAA